MIDSERYDLQAKSEKVVTPDEMLPMLRALLQDRFKLKFHWDTKPGAVYELAVARSGPKLKEHQEGNCYLPGTSAPASAPGYSFAGLPCGRLIFFRRPI